MVGPQVGAGGESDGDARGRLADDEPPPGEVAPQRTELATAVYVGASRLGVHGGQLRRGCGVAPRHGGGEDEADQHARTGGVRSWTPRAEHAGADHRAGADGHGVAHAESPLQLRRHRRADGVVVGAMEHGRVSGGRAGRAPRSSPTDLAAGSAGLRGLSRHRCERPRRRRRDVRPRRRCRRR